MGDLEKQQARVSFLKARYLEAVSSAESVVAELLRGELPEPGGSLAYRNALIAERAALERYMDARRDATILTLQGKSLSGGT